ncbi:MAG: DUF3618 domain-containing protein [Actinobacteria bacterium]|nr:DUF3618 domain-containing protein [Actinomycetota bacterium]MBI3687619.1 DUF3618 domain-containing protein [Actinomycetota bacterium]
MTRDPDTIQAEIEQARDRLAGALDQIATRYSPRAVAERGSRTVRAGLRSPAGVTAVGVAGVLVVLLVVRRFRRG